MTMTTAPKVPRHKIRRLYQGDARGLLDPHLVNEVAYGFYARCQDMLARMHAPPAQPNRPRRVVERPARWEGFVKQARYPWEISWRVDFEDYDPGDDVAEVLAHFVDNLPRAKSPREKMLLVNRLTHACHNSLKRPAPGEPLAVQLITGGAEDILALLNELAYGE